VTGRSHGESSRFTAHVSVCRAAAINHSA